MTKNTDRAITLEDIKNAVEKLNQSKLPDVVQVFDPYADRVVSINRNFLPPQSAYFRAYQDKLWKRATDENL